MQFLLEVVDILLNYVRKTFDRSTKVLDFHHPHQLLEGMEGFNLELSDHPESLEQILVDCRDTLKYGVRTGNVEGQVDLQRHLCPAADLCQWSGCQSQVERETQTLVKEAAKYSLTTEPPEAPAVGGRPNTGLIIIYCCKNRLKGYRCMVLCQVLCRVSLLILGYSQPKESRMVHPSLLFCLPFSSLPHF